MNIYARRRGMADYDDANALYAEKQRHEAAMHALVLNLKAIRTEGGYIPFSVQEIADTLEALNDLGYS